MAKKIMIVEDNELNMKLFHDLLKANGFAVVGTRDGRKAVELANKVTRTINDIRTAEAPGPDESLVPEPAATEDTPAELPPDHPHAAHLDVYHWLTFMQDMLVEVLMSR